MSDGAREVAERTARAAYGRLLAMLAVRGAGIAAAEDALADAFAAALRTWPDRGVPAVPEAWLLTAARRTIGHTRARTATASAGVATLLLLDDERTTTTPTIFGDDRLKLLFVCAYPAIDPAVQAPLMLQTVLGLDAGRIAASFLVSPAVMSARLVRAKRKIRDAGIGFDIPDVDRIDGRVEAVLAAIYAAFGTGWENVLGADAKRRGLAGEAIWLGRLMCELLPANPECAGLLALMLHCEARRPARRDAAGGFVPLHRQDPRGWTAGMIVEAEQRLRDAARFGVPGRFQIEAAIQSLHAQTVMTGEANTSGLIALYDLLVAVAPSLGARVARACALAESGAAEVALDELDQLADRCRAYQPWWAARARTLWLLGRPGDARAAADVAAGLSADPAVRDHLLSGALFATRAQAERNSQS